jgi:hypothetical protein
MFQNRNRSLFLGLYGSQFDIFAAHALSGFRIHRHYFFRTNFPRHGTWESRERSHRVVGMKLANIDICFALGCSNPTLSQRTCGRRISCRFMFRQPRAAAEMGRWSGGERSCGLLQCHGAPGWNMIGNRFRIDGYSNTLLCVSRHAVGKKGGRVLKASVDLVASLFICGTLERSRQMKRSMR